VETQLPLLPPDPLTELLEEGRRNYKLSIGSTDMLYWSGWVEALMRLKKAQKEARQWETKTS
jgi:hypothetical protein